MLGYKPTFYSAADDLPHTRLWRNHPLNQQVQMGVDENEFLPCSWIFHVADRCRYHVHDKDSDSLSISWKGCHPRWQVLPVDTVRISSTISVSNWIPVPIKKSRKDIDLDVLSRFILLFAYQVSTMISAINFYKLQTSRLRLLFMISFTCNKIVYLQFFSTEEASWKCPRFLEAASTEACDSIQLLDEGTFQ